MKSSGLLSLLTWSATTLSFLEHLEMDGRLPQQAESLGESGLTSPFFLGL